MSFCDTTSDEDNTYSLALTKEDLDDLYLILSDVINWAKKDEV